MSFMTSSCIIYYVLVFSPSKIYFLAKTAFAVKEEEIDELYSHETILKWLKVFYRRFFSQQFKRSCLPDGPKIGSICLSPEETGVCQVML